MDSRVARDRFAAERVATLATIDASDRPHAVPIVFAVVGESICLAVDDKPKSSRELKRLANISRVPAVSVLVHRYADDWSELWWVRADGRAAIVDAGSARGAAAIDALSTKYPQYRDAAMTLGPVIVIEVDRWSGWQAEP
jgi:PPOX class probable F420-dependent enzyme